MSNSAVNGIPKNQFVFFPSILSFLVFYIANVLTNKKRKKNSETFGPTKSCKVLVFDAEKMIKQKKITTTAEIMQKLAFCSSRKKEREKSREEI